MLTTEGIKFSQFRVLETVLSRVRFLSLLCCKSPDFLFFVLRCTAIYELVLEITVSPPVNGALFGKYASQLRCEVTFESGVEFLLLIVV